MFYPKHTLELQEGIIPDQYERLECRHTPPCSDVNFLNDLSRGLNVDNSQFGVMLGEGTKTEVADIIHEQSNMGGRDPDMEKKVGLLDRHHLMCFLVDLHGYKWGSTFLIYTNIAMGGGDELYTPFGEDGPFKSCERVTKESMISIATALAFISTSMTITLTILLCLFRNSTLIRVNGLKLFLSLF